MLTALLGVGASNAWAQLAVSTVGDLGFGNFVAGSGGAIVISTNGTRNATGDVLLLTSATVSAGAFNVSDFDPANASATYSILLPANDTVTLSSGSNTMTLRDFVSNPSGSGILSGGSQTLNVGATLVVGANQPPGNYSGTYTITIDYQ